MILVFPHDPSTAFLKEIADKLKPFLSKDIDRAMPNEYDKTISFIDSSPNSTFLFLGHGYSDGLYGGCYVIHGREILVKKDVALKLFNGRRIILFCCRSSEFLSKVEGSFQVAIGFGNIKTSKEDLLTKADKEKYRDPESIRLFREKLVTIFTNALIETITMKYSFYQFYNSLKLRINKMICKFSLSKNPNEILAGELMFELRKEMILSGKQHTPVL
jgi:hypothetical protein